MVKVVTDTIQRWVSAIVFSRRWDHRKYLEISPADIITVADDVNIVTDVVLWADVTCIL
jgi:hypothetical protein